jgi:hypothetical protein
LRPGIVLPKEAEPLKAYRRYYRREGGEVLAVYVAGEKPGREWVPHQEAFSIHDGGCTVVNVRFEVQSKRIDAFCNGEA